ncbi:uncharacterized protein [Miscanthus floridulus]|uniref:uncharacterized protein isoform X2 n=1 Tax=Miscanthus floridulus TaxID=154761 RepID=UPI0034580020
MSTTEQDEFKAAFVVYVMSTLLAPCAKHDRVPDDYLHTIEQPGQICSYDWDEYVIRRLLDAVLKLKADIANNVKVPYIYGCSLFLQVLYLDSIDLGVLSMEHNIFPQIRCFTSDRLRSMIAADSSFSANGCDMVGSRRTKLRPAIGICYHWATSQRSNLGSPNQSGMLALWEASVLMSRILKIPRETCVLWATHMFVATLNVVPIFPQLGPRGSRTQIDATINKRQHMINNNDPLNPELPPGSFLDAGDRCVNATDVSIQAVLNRHDIDIRAINAMARFCLTLRPVKATRCTDLNTRPHGDDLAATAFHTRAGHPLPGPRSPWDLGCRYTIDLVKASDIHKKIDEPWIVHFCPKYIEVLTCVFKSQFLGNSELEMELVDAVIRRYKQVDDELYAHEGPARWRHLVESDFMVSLLAGWFNISDPVLRSHYCGRHICYDVTACQILFFFNIGGYVLPGGCTTTLLSCTIRALTSYEHVAKLLKSAMMLVSTTISQGWRYDWEDARLEVFHDHTCITWGGSRKSI